MDEQLSFPEFTQLALRTESKVLNPKINVQAFGTLLHMFVTVGTLLDYIKKGIFYNNYSKYDDYVDELTVQLKKQTALFEEYNNSGEFTRIENPLFNFRVIHGLLGASTEASEIAEHLLNYLYDGTIDKAGIGEEFSDSDWYKAIIFDELNLDESVCRQNVINKLKIRFPDKYSDEAAANRNLNEERIKLEENM
jgi:hypothetical protein